MSLVINTDIALFLQAVHFMAVSQELEIFHSQKIGNVVPVDAESAGFL